MDLSELKELIEKQGKAWEEFRKTNDERLAKLEKGQAVGDLEEKLAKINAELTRIEREAKAKFEEAEKKANRPRLGAGDPESQAAELKLFNAMVKSHARRLSRAVPAEVTAEEYSTYKTAFGSFVRKGKEELTSEERKALTIGSDPDGGYLIVPEMEAGLDRVLSKLSAVRARATIRTIGTTSYKKGVVTSGATGGWAGETETPTETNTPRIEELEFTPGKVWAEPHATSDMLEDVSFNVEGWLQDEVEITFSELEGQAFISGTGVKQPRGFLSYDIVANASYAWGKVGYVKTGGAAGFAASNPSDALLDLIHGLRRQYRNGASFMLNDLTLASIRKFKDGNGIYLWVPGLQQGQVGVLLGYPVDTDDFMPDLGANTYPIAYADFRRAYVVVDRRGTVVLRDPFTRKPWIKFYTTRRVGGGIQNFEAIKLLKCEA